MIPNDEALAVVRQQLARAERALEALRRRKMHPSQLAVFSEGYIDQIADLRSEIDNYCRAAKKKDPSAGKSVAPRKRQKT
jgi:hypothetical protein